MEQFIGLIVFGLSILSTAVTAWFWLVRTNRERPRLRTVVTAPVLRDVDMSYRRFERASKLAAFVEPDPDAKKKSHAGIGRYYFLLKALIINDSALPSTVSSIRLRVRTKEGGWLDLNTAFLPADEGPTGPFAFTEAEAQASREARQPLEPRTFVIPAERGTALRLIGWIGVPLGNRSFEWDRVEEERIEASVKQHVEGLLVQPLQGQAVLHTLTGPRFTSTLHLESGELPDPVTLRGIAMPPLQPIKVQLKPRQQTAVIERLRKDLEATAQPDGTFADSSGADSTTDLEGAAYAVLAFKTMGWPMPQESATRDWLLARQRPDGTFLHTQDSLARGLPVDAPLHRLENCHAALMALHALGVRPLHDPLPAFTQAVRDYIAHQQAEREAVPATLAHRAVHVHLLCGKSLPSEIDKLVRPLIESAPVGSGEWRDWGRDAVYDPVRYYRLQRQAVPQAEARFAWMLRDAGRRGYIAFDSWSYQSNDRGRSYSLLAGAYTAYQLAPDSAVTRRLLDEVAAFIFEKGQESEHFPWGCGRQRQFYCTFACLILAGAVKPERPLSCDPHLFGLGEHMAAK